MLRRYPRQTGTKERRDSMRQFKMKGTAINGPERFKEYFSVQDLLEQRELAAGFLLSAFRHLTDAGLYHAEMFYSMVFEEKLKYYFFAFKNYQNYYKISIILKALPHKYCAEPLNEYFRQPEQQERLMELWELTQETGLEGQAQKQLFCMLMAAYSLAEKRLADCPIAPEEVKRLFLRKKTIVQEEKWLAFSGAGDIQLNARQQPYHILMLKGAAEQLKRGTGITLRKVTALPHIQGAPGVPVTLRLYKSPEDNNPCAISIQVGDYVYINFVGDVPVWLHPTMQESDYCRIARSGIQLTVTDKQTRVVKTMQNSNVVPIGFVVEQQNAGWVLMYNGGLDDTYYSGRWSFPLASKKNIVQVQFRGTECLLLDSSGRVESNFRGMCGEGIVTLERFRGGKADE